MFLLILIMSITASNSHATAAPDDSNITFEDVKVKALCVSNWDTSGDGELSQDEAAAVTDLGTVFKGNEEIMTFEELHYFTGLTSISNAAFQECFSLKSITLPNNITSIGDCAFLYCKELTSIVIPDEVSVLGNNAFTSCINLSTLPIGNGVTSIKSYCFEICRFTSITIPRNVSNIEYGAFRGCSLDLLSISVDEANPYYDSRNNCNAIIETASNTLVLGCRNTTVPDDIRNIGLYAFDGCSELTSTTIPNGVTNIGVCAYSGCSGLTSITIPGSVTSIDTDAFSGCI